MRVLVAAATEQYPRKDNEDALRCADSVCQALSIQGVSSEKLLIQSSDLVESETLFARIRSFKPDCVFNLFEGFSYDSCAEFVFVKLLECRKIIFTGNTSQTLELCLNKSENNSVLRKAGVNVPAGHLIKDLKIVNDLQIAYPVFLKPVNEDASVGIDSLSLCRNVQELNNALACKLSSYPAGILVEDFIDGTEYNVSFTGRAPYEMTGVSALDYSSCPGISSFLSYDAKWNESTSDFKQLLPVVQASLEPVLLKEIRRQCLLAGQASGCRGYFRIDLRVRNGKLFVLDVNPNPDINRDSGFIRQAVAAGYSYEDIVLKIVKEAMYGEF